MKKSDVVNEIDLKLCCFKYDKEKRLEFIENIIDMYYETGYTDAVIDIRDQIQEMICDEDENNFSFLS